MVYLIYLFCLLIRVVVGLWGYSGFGKAPMFGDFEAQRHWLEITVNTYIGNWYKQTTDNDLLYWGLDYPPLTAYVSYLFGLLAKLTYPSLITLKESRGHETDIGKFFMRTSVLLCDLAIFFPAAYHLIKFIYRPKKNIELSLIIVLISPALVLIDHGHFQYNCVCIGLTLSGIYYILKGKHLLGSLYFCLSLNFKQMALYYSPVFFFALLRKCYEIAKIKSYFRGLVKLISIGSIVIITFSVLWFPFCYYATPPETCTSSTFQVN